MSINCEITNSFKEMKNQISLLSKIKFNLIGKRNKLYILCQYL